MHNYTLLHFGKTKYNNDTILPMLIYRCNALTLESPCDTLWICQTHGAIYLEEVGQNTKGNDGGLTISYFKFCHKVTVVKKPIVMG